MFGSGLRKVVGNDKSMLAFRNALDYSNRLEKDYESWFDSAMQYVNVDFSEFNSDPSEILTKASARSASTRSLYLVCMEADTFKELADIAMEQETFEDMISGRNKDASWCVRVRRMDRAHFGKKLRNSSKLVMQATREMSDMLRKVRWILCFPFENALSFTNRNIFVYLELIVWREG